MLLLTKTSCLALFSLACVDIHRAFSIVYPLSTLKLPFGEFSSQSHHVEILHFYSSIFFPCTSVIISIILGVHEWSKNKNFLKKHGPASVFHEISIIYSTITPLAQCCPCLISLVVLNLGCCFDWNVHTLIKLVYVTLSVTFIVVSCSNLNSLSCVVKSMLESRCSTTTCSIVLYSSISMTAIIFSVLLRSYLFVIVLLFLPSFLPFLISMLVLFQILSFKMLCNFDFKFQSLSFLNLVGSSIFTPAGFSFKLGCPLSLHINRKKLCQDGYDSVTSCGANCCSFDNETLRVIQITRVFKCRFSVINRSTYAINSVVCIITSLTLSIISSGGLIFPLWAFILLIFIFLGINVTLLEVQGRMVQKILTIPSIASIERWKKRNDTQTIQNYGGQSLIIPIHGDCSLNDNATLPWISPSAPSDIQPSVYPPLPPYNPASEPLDVIQSLDVEPEVKESILLPPPPAYTEVVSTKDFCFKKCDNVKCITCVRVCETGSLFMSTSTGKEYDLNDDVTCTTTTVIYLVTCKNCHLQYVGKTEQSLKQRHYGHRREVDLKSTPLGLHFSSTSGVCIDCNYDSHFSFQIIDHVSDASKLRDREGFWIVELQTLFPNGINLRDESNSNRK